MNTSLPIDTGTWRAVVVVAILFSVLLYVEHQQQAIEDAYVAAHACTKLKTIGPAYDADLIYQCDTGQISQSQIRAGSGK